MLSVIGGREHGDESKVLAVTEGGLHLRQVGVGGNDHGQLASSQSGDQLFLHAGTNGIQIALSCQIGPFGIVIGHNIGKAIAVIIIQALGRQAGGTVLVIRGIESLPGKGIVGPNAGMFL